MLMRLLIEALPFLLPDLPAGPSSDYAISSLWYF
jgi:hypothetical protein